MKLSLSKLSVVFLLALAACLPEPKAPPPRKQATYHKPPPVVSERNTIVSKGVIPPMTPMVKVALLLPLSGDSVAVGTAMLDAATMALSDSYLTLPSDQIRSQVILIPKDTGNSTADVAKATQQAVDQGANFIIGPLFSQSVASVAPIAQARNISLLTFSNTKSIAQRGVYVFGFLPEQQVNRIAEYAYLNGFQRVALLAPNDTYGQKVKDTLSASYKQKGGTMAPYELYAPTPANIDAAVARMSQAYNNMTEDRRFQAIFIADGGYQLKNIINSLKKYNFDLKKIKLLGTGLWDDPEIAKMPEMAGAWFPSSPPDSYEVFEKHFVATYGYKPVRLASLAYDAVALAATLSLSSPVASINDAALTDPKGFISPANGLFRLNMDGTSDRKLAIMEVTPEGFKIIDRAPNHF